MSRVGMLENAWRDALYALRSMRKNPGFAGAAVLTMALAIGGNTAMFTVVRAVLLKPLAYPGADRLVRFTQGASPARFDEMKAARSFSGLGAFTGQESPTLSGGAEPEVLTGARVSANFLAILGVNPILGRSFLPQEDSPGGTPVVLISSELWQRRYASDPHIAGKTAVLETTPYTIIGVLPARFQFPYPDVDVWMTAPSEWPLMAAKSRQLSPFLTLFGRLQPGVTLAQANAEAVVIHRQYALGHPAMLDAKPKQPEEVTPLKEQLVSNVRVMLWMLFGAVGLVLLIACANIASLLLARASSRAREFAVRSALGAARSRLIGQLLAESILLACAGGAIGVMLAAWSLRAIPHMSAIELPRAGEIHLDGMVLGFAVALSVGTGVLFGLAPALGISQPDLISVLRGTGAASPSAQHRSLTWFSSRSLLVVGQVALSVVLLIGAALLIESVTQLRRVEVGFNPANLLTLRVSLPQARYDTNYKRNRFFEELVRRVESSHGVRSVTAAGFLPMTEYAGTPVQDAGQPPLKLNERPIATIMTVTPGYFHTLEISIRRGRDFNEQDKDGAQRVAIIDEALARRFWPSYPAGQDPIGQRLLVGGLIAQPAQIVGIVAHVRQNL